MQCSAAKRLPPRVVSRRHAAGALRHAAVVALAILTATGFGRATAATDEPVPDEPVRSFAAYRLGGQITMRIAARDAAAAQAAADAAFAEAKRLDAILSDYDPDSELNRLMDLLSDGVPAEAPLSVRISADLDRCLFQAFTLAEQTDGAFDPTIGPLTHLWRRAKRRRRLPTSEAIADARRAIGFRKYAMLPRSGHGRRIAQRISIGRRDCQEALVDRKQPLISPTAAMVLRQASDRAALGLPSADLARLLPSDCPVAVDQWIDGDIAGVSAALIVTRCPPDPQFDLGGVAKGFVLDRLAVVLQEAGFERFLIDAGGDIVCRPGNGPAFKIGVAPTVGVKEPPQVFLPVPSGEFPRRLAVATSGDAAQFHTVDGRRYSHLIDPRTGEPIERRSSVTVVASTATHADAFASALSVLDPSAAIGLVDRSLPAGVRLSWIGKDGTEKVWTSQSWPHWRDE